MAIVRPAILSPKPSSLNFRGFRIQHLQMIHFYNNSHQKIQLPGKHKRVLIANIILMQAEERCIKT